MLGRTGGYFGFLRPCVLRFGGDVGSGWAPESVAASVVAEEEVRGDIGVTLEKDPSVELALASGTGRARSLPRVNICRDCHGQFRLIFYDRDRERGG